jgi:hypothetical protein
MKKILILASIIFLSCDNKDTLEESGTALDFNTYMRQSSFYENVEAAHINNGLPSNCENNILIFPDWETYFNTIEKIDEAIELHCDFFEANANPNFTDEQYEDYAASIGFDEDEPLRKFENDLRFCSLWKKIFDQETAWLSQQGDGEWDADQDPDNHFVFEDSERVLLNEYAEVMIGDRKKGLIIYKFYEWGNIEIHNNDFVSLQQINLTGIIPTDNPNVIVNDEKSETSEVGVDCKGGATQRKYFSTGSSTRIKAVDKLKSFSGQPRAWKNSKIKSKTKYYRKKGVWRRGKTTLSAGWQDASCNVLSYWADWRSCGSEFRFDNIKTRKRSKVKNKYKYNSSDIHYRIFDNQLFGVHKRRNDVTKKIDYYDGEVQ